MAPKPRPPIDRSTEKTKSVDSGCIEWTAYIGENGYGRFYFEGRGALAHRWSYEYHVGPIPEGLVIDHLCRNHACVRPDHLEPVTTGENVRRGVGPLIPTERARARTHCPNGHPYADDGLNAKGYRCLICKRDSSREHYEQNRQTYIDRAAVWRQNNLDRAREVTRESQRRYRAKNAEN